MEHSQLLSVGMPKIRRRLNSAYLFVAPAVIFIFILVFLPTVRIAILSVTQTNARTNETRFVGFQNFATILSDANFQQAALQTGKWTLFTALGHFIIGFALALAMNSTLIYKRIRSFCRALILLPWALTPVVVALILQLWAHPMISPIAKILTAVGFHGDFQPLGDPKIAMWTLIVVQIWQFSPFFMIMILAGLQSLDPALHDAAKVDGASWWQDVYFVILPHVRELLLTLGLFDVVTLAASFDLIWVATNGGPVRSTEVISTYLYRDGFLGNHWNLAGTTGIILLLLLSLIAYFMIRQMRDE
jgi:multiple sugar transport system permease protein